MRWELKLCNPVVGLFFCLMENTTLDYRVRVVFEAGHRCTTFETNGRETFLSYSHPAFAAA